MSNKTDKPKLSPEKLVEKMKTQKGITFKYIDENEAADFLSDSNNYLRTACYRVAYPKYQAGKDKGKYIALDFAYLKELSIIDMHYRFIVKKMCSDIEHGLSMRLLNLIDNDPSTDGYDIVKDFLDNHPYVVANLERSISSPHSGDLIKKYFSISVSTSASGRKTSTITAYDDCPAWVLTECLTFGDLIEFYAFYCKSKNIMLPADWATLSLVRNLRNGASHEACLLCHINAGTTTPSKQINLAVKNIPTISTSQRQKKLSSRTLLEFTAMIYLYDILVSGKVREHRTEELRSLFYKRFPEKKGFFINNTVLTSSYDFCCKIIEYFL